MYAKTLLMDKLLKKLDQDTFTLEWVSQETIDLMIKKWLIIKIPELWKK